MTNFIKSTVQRKGKSYNTQHSIASEITKFLNFCIDNVNSNSEFEVLKKEGVFGLSLIHGSEYISYYTARAKKGEVKSEYVYRIEKNLIEFYGWLNKQSIISIPELAAYKGEGDTPFNDIELGTNYPSKDENIPDKIVDFGENRINLTIALLNVAEIEAPDIALGIVFQFFGGLRRSEVVNLTVESLEGFQINKPLRRKTLILKIRDNQDILFAHLLNHTKEQVKRTRDQSIMPFEIVMDILKRHLKELDLIEKRGIQTNKSALFIDYKTGQPLNGLQYYRRFTKVKDAFLTKLSNDNHIDFDFLNDNNWSTHIGRGVFTNILLERGADIVTTAIARGDKTLDTVIKYVDRKIGIKSTQAAVNHLHKGLEKERLINAYKRGESIIDYDDLF